MFYRLSADIYGDPAYPRIFLSVLIEQLSLHGTKSLKTILIRPPPVIDEKSPKKGSKKAPKK